MLQAERLLRQQRALLDQYSNPHSRISKGFCHTADLRANENDYWHSYNDDTARPALQEVSVSDAALMRSACASDGHLHEHEVTLPAARSAEYAGQNSNRSSRTSSVASLSTKKVANRRKQHSIAGHQVEINPPACQGCVTLLETGLDCTWCKDGIDTAPPV